MDEKKNSRLPHKKKEKEKENSPILELYHRQAFGRTGKGLKEALWSIFSAFASFGRYVIEVIIRENFGIRYFRLRSALTVFFGLAIFPVLLYVFKPLVIIFRAWQATYLGMPYSVEEALASSFIAHFVDYITWYLYLLVYLVMCIKHYDDQDHKTGIFRTDHFSLYSGDINPRFVKLNKRLGWKVSERTISCWLEPGVFFLGGILLAIIGQMLGWLLIWCSLVYAASYLEAYQWGDNRVLDIIDKKLVNAYMQDTLHDPLNPMSRSGFREMWGMPDDPDMAKQVVSEMIDEDEDEDSFTVAG